MGHNVEGFIAKMYVLKSAVKDFKNANVVNLDTEFGLLLNTDEFFDEVVQGRVSLDQLEASESAVFWKLHPNLEDLALRISQTEAVMYFETDYWGGSGTQSTIVWQSRNTIYGPSKSGSVKVTPDTPINSALRLLGVRRDPNQLDEFDTIGLGKFRSNENWILQPSFGKAVIVSNGHCRVILNKLRRWFKL